jgi:hypothetical protein
MFGLMIFTPGKQHLSNKNYLVDSALSQTALFLPKKALKTAIS